MRNYLSRSSKVIDYDTNRMPLCNFVLVVNSNSGLTCIWHRVGSGLWDTRRLKGQNLAFFGILHLDLTPSLGVILSEFLDEPYLAEN